MSDTIGAQSFPLGRPVPNETHGDPALGHLVEFLMGSVNAACGRKWDAQGVSPGRKVVAFAFTHDPKKLFEENRLPAIYAWRSKSVRSRAADELRKKTTTIKIAWIGEGASESQLIARDTMMNAIADAIDRAISKGRDPTWRIDGDTDPLATRRGSSLVDICGWSRAQPTDDAPQELMFQRIEEAAALPYYGFDMGVDVDEYQENEDADRFAYPAALDAAVSTNSPLTVATISDGQRIHWDVP